MAILDVFTGDPQKKAAQQSRDYLAQQAAQTAAQIAAAQKTGTEALQSGQAGALSAVGGGIDQARSDISGATPQATNALYAGAGAGAGALMEGQQGGLDTLRSGVTAAKGAYDPLAAAAGRYGETAGSATQAQLDALGLNGPEGIARSQATFQATPGYQFGLNQGLESILRNANVGGGAAGGNVLRESQQFGQGLANQEFDKYKAGLLGQQQLYSPLERGALTDVASGTAGAELTGGTGGANIITGTGQRLSDLYSGTGRAGSDLYATEGRSLADLATKGGLTESSIYQTGGQNLADLVSGLTKAQVGYTAGQLKDYTKTYTDEAAAQTAASKNLWDLGGQAVTFGATGGFNPASYAQVFSPKPAARG